MEYGSLDVLHTKKKGLVSEIFIEKSFAEPQSFISVPVLLETSFETFMVSNAKEVVFKESRH